MKNSIIQVNALPCKGGIARLMRYQKLSPGFTPLPLVVALENYRSAEMQSASLVFTYNR